MHCHERRVSGAVSPCRVSQLPAHRPGKAGAAQAERPSTTMGSSWRQNENPYADPTGRRCDRRSSGRGEPVTATIAPAELYLQSRSGSVHSDDHVTVRGSLGLIQQLLDLRRSRRRSSRRKRSRAYPIDTMLMGAQLVSVPLVDGAFDLDAVADAVTERTKLVLIATPNNPTGPAVSTDALRAMLEQILAEDWSPSMSSSRIRRPVFKHSGTISFPTFQRCCEPVDVQGLRPAGLRVGYLVATQPLSPRSSRRRCRSANTQAGALVRPHHRVSNSPKSM